MADPTNGPAKLSRRMSVQDASFLYAETPEAPLHIGGLTIFAGILDYDELAHHLGARIHLLPRYRQRVIFAPLNLAHPSLEEDRDFDVHNHIMAHTLEEQGEPALFAATMREFARILDRGKPLWEAHLFTGFAEHQSAILWKMHHCLVDGVAGMDLLNASLDLRPDAPVLPTPSRRRLEPLPGPAKSFATAFLDTVQKRLDEAREAAALIEKPIAAAERLASTVNIAGRMMHMFSRRIAAAPWNARLVSNERSLGYLKIPFAELRTIRNVLGGTANDAVLAILGEAAARYMAHHDVHGGDYPIRIGCPVNVRREAEGGLGNRVSMMFPELAAAPMDAVARLRAVVATTMKLKMAREPQALDYLLAGAEMIPPPLIGAGSAISTTAAGAATKISTLLPAVRRILPLPAPAINFIATNVPGAQVPLYLAGRKMIDMIGCVPIAANLGYSVAIVSYNRDLIFGMMADPQLMPDLDRMRLYAMEVFDELAKAARLAAPQKRYRVANPEKRHKPPAV